MSIEEYFESDEFIKALAPIKSILERNTTDRNCELIGYLLEISIKYSILLGGEKGFSTLGLNDFVKNITTKISKSELPRYKSFHQDKDLTEYVSKVCANALLEKLNITRQSLNDDITKVGIFSYIVKNLKGRNHKYHAFNSANLNSIKENGINPIISNTNQEEIDEMYDIFNNYGITMICGWQKLNCEKKVSYSYTPSVSYDYATRSPEWFSQFTGGAFAFNPIEKYQKDAFVRQDYEAAKNNLLTLMAAKKFKTEDKSKVLEFFEKNWNIYAKSNPMLVIVPAQCIEEQTKIWIEILEDKFRKNNIDEMLEYCLFDNYGKDCQTQETIDVKDALFIKLPNYKRLIEKVCNQKEQKEEKNESQRENLYNKLLFLNQVKIKVKIDAEGNKTWVSDHGNQEVEKLKGILQDEEVFQAIITDKFNNPFLLAWIKNFDKNILNSPNNIKKIALHHPVYFQYISDDAKNDLELMRECAHQKGIKSALISYVGDKVQDDFEFITELIINSDEKTFDFVGQSINSIEGSNMAYGKLIGETVQLNPNFWRILNSKIASINKNTSRYIPELSIDKELELINNSVMFKDETNISNIETQKHKHTI